MSNTLSVALAQINLLLGDIEGNTDKIITTAFSARDNLAADLIIFPELSLTGYPPEDLLWRPELDQRTKTALDKIMAKVTGICIVVGHSQWVNENLYNTASVIQNGKIIAQYHKQHLPNYSVFDEKRYFHPGNKPCIITLNNIKIAVTLCEDLWQPGPLTLAKQAGAECVVSLNASPFYHQKFAQRLEAIQKRQKQEAKLPIFYVNLIGGQDELVFDGSSMVIDAQGTLIHRSVAFSEALDVVTVKKDKAITLQPGKISHDVSHEANIYQALVLGLRDYINKNNFPGVLVGLSGGIDSALTLTIAVDALGAGRVTAVMMPSRYTAVMSNEDALIQAKTLGVQIYNLPIEPIFQAVTDTLSHTFKGLASDTTEENIQARCRGTLLMALSNKLGHLVLTTGNKSEMAVGYATLYGDMAGGYAVLKDVLKTVVYRLAIYRNSIKSVIPQRVIDRPPSAELRHEQTDEDSLPPYSILDAIIIEYVENNHSPEAIIQKGFDHDIVAQTVRLIDRNEYKRRQAPPGVKITPRAFGRDWRYPITSGFSRSRP